MAYNPKQYNNMTRISLHESYADLIWYDSAYLSLDIRFHNYFLIGCQILSCQTPYIPKIRIIDRSPTEHYYGWSPTVTCYIAGGMDRPCRPLPLVNVSCFQAIRHGRVPHGLIAIPIR